MDNPTTPAFLSLAVPEAPTKPVVYLIYQINKMRNATTLLHDAHQGREL